VYQEQVKWMPGIAAESRSFDANGQYVRSLVNGANYAYPLNDGRLFVTGAPIMGVNPPKADASPPYRPEVACETQQAPDLRSNPQQPPQEVKVDHNAPGARAASEKARLEATKFLREDLEHLGLKTPVGETLIGDGDLKRLTKAMPGR
jgi:hypothetical protein